MILYTFLIRVWLSKSIYEANSSILVGVVLSVFSELQFQHVVVTQYNKNVKITRCTCIDGPVKK